MLPCPLTLSLLSCPWLASSLFCSPRWTCGVWFWNEKRRREMTRKPWRRSWSTRSWHRISGLNRRFLVIIWSYSCFEFENTGKSIQTAQRKINRSWKRNWLDHYPITAAQKSKSAIGLAWIVILFSIIGVRGLHSHLQVQSPCYPVTQIRQSLWNENHKDAYVQ